MKRFVWAVSIMTLFLFRLAINFECRFYGFVFWMILIGFLYDVWTERIWPEIAVPVAEGSQNTGDWTPVQPR
jgi:hypothetical protein